MKGKLMLAAFAVITGSVVFAQNVKAPNEGEKVTFLTPVSPGNQEFFQKAPTTLWQDNADESWYNGTATEFTLTTAAQVAGLAKIVNAGNNFAGKTVTIGADLDFGVHLWMPIGKSYQFPFSGIIKGNNKKVSNIFINLPDGDFVG